MDSLIQAAEGVLAGMLTPELLGAVILTLAATHTVKVLAEAWLDTVTETAAKWRAFCVLASVLIGAFAGTATWVGTGVDWFIVPAVAFGSGPAWRLAQTVMPGHARDALLTATDRRFRGKSHAG